MIDAQMFISGPENSPAGTLFGHPSVVTPPPYELLGQFLTSDVDSSGCVPFTELPKSLAQASRGHQGRLEGGGNGHLLTIEGDTVTIETLFAEPPVVLTMALRDFSDVFGRWKEFVKKHERRQRFEERKRRSSNHDAP